MENMENFIAAINNKLSTSDLNNDVGGRIYWDSADDFTTPYVVIKIVTDDPDLTFTEDESNGILQVSMFSSLSAGVSQISTMHKHCITLFNECSLTIPPTGTVTDKLIWMRRSNFVTMLEENPTVEGGIGLRHWAQDFEYRTSKV
jgi:hypothetical protein